jgi:hypothetical protein
VSAAQKILRDSTDTLLVYPQLSAGGPALLEQAASCTVRIGTPAVAMPSSSSSATVDSLSATTATEASEGDTSLVVASAATWIRGRQYLLTLTTGEVLVVASEKSGSSTTLYLSEPVPCAVPSGSTVKGYALTKALTADQTAQVGEGLALWTPSLTSISATFAQQFRIVRRIPRWTLTERVLTTSYPLLHTLRARNDVTFGELLQTVWDMRLLPLLEARGIRAEQIMSPDRLEPVHAIMCVHHLLALDPAREQAFVDRWAEEARQAFETALAGKELWIDADDEEATARDEDAPPAEYTRTRWGR